MEGIVIFTQRLFPLMTWSLEQNSFAEQGMVVYWYLSLAFIQLSLSDLIIIPSNYCSFNLSSFSGPSSACLVKPCGLNACEIESSI